VIFLLYSRLIIGCTVLRLLHRFARRAVQGACLFLIFGL
jgi:hypothetical protein